MDNYFKRKGDSVIVTLPCMVDDAVMALPYEKEELELGTVIEIAIIESHARVLLPSDDGFRFTVIGHDPIKHWQRTYQLSDFNKIIFTMSQYNKGTQ